VTIKDKKNKIKNCEDENIQFNFLGTKIKIRYIYRDEKLFLIIKLFLSKKKLYYI